MIDKNYQKNGYGSKLIKNIIYEVNKDNDIDYILTDYVVGNEKMKYLLEKFGFVYYKYIEEWKEVAMKYYKKEVKNDNN